MASDIGLLIGGCGGAYFLPEPGELVVEVVKRDRNAQSTTCELRALLVSPDRTVVAEATIPDDGQPVGSGLGPAAAVRLTTTVERPGVYSLNVTVSQDRYGTQMLWGFRSNCPRHLVATARGHRDERHQEPIVLFSPDAPVEVCFRPRPGPIEIAVAGLPPGTADLHLTDAGGAVLTALPVDDQGRATGTVPAGERGPGPCWRLCVPAGETVLDVDGLTRWQAGDPNQDVCVWSADPGSWFPLLENWWLLTPYRRTLYAAAGAGSRASFWVRNNAAVPRTIDLSVEYPGSHFPVRLSERTVELAPGASQQVELAGTLPAQLPVASCHLRATPADGAGFSTYSTLTLRAGQAPAAAAISTPLQLLPYRHENELLGYAPEYPTAAQAYFGPDNAPYVQQDGLRTRREGQWVGGTLDRLVTTRPAAVADAPLTAASTKIAFDADGDVYLLAQAAGRGLLLHSSDGGQSFSAYLLPGRSGALDFEQFSGNNTPAGPPPVVRFVRTQTDPDLIWRAVHDLELFLPRKTDGRIELGAPITVTTQAIGYAGHSGMPSSVVSREAKVHVVWGEATDPQVEVPGVPTYVATYDRAAAGLGAPALVGYGPPANDVHNTPSITMDADGYLHVLVGTHGQPFQYTASRAPNDAAGGWSEPQVAGEDLGQTYIGLVCDRANTLHAVFRLWRRGEPYPASWHATLAYQRKRPGQAWEAPRLLLVAPFSEYSVFYHRLTIDRRGRLFLSYDYWSTYWFYRNDHPGSRRALMMSPDGGDTWRMAGAGGASGRGAGAGRPDGGRALVRRSGAPI